jgi:hypothetical protein
LELRSLPATMYLPLTNALSEQGFNDVLDPETLTNNVGHIALLSPSQVRGHIGNGPHADADIDWFKFQLDSAAIVDITAFTGALGSSLDSVVSLYVLTPFEFGDPQNPYGFRKLAQDDGGEHSGEGSINRALGEGTYYVAVSGSGNRHFNPLLPGSGYPGSTGDYVLQITASAFPVSIGPAVLHVSPGDQASLPGSPFAIRVSLTSALDVSTLVPGQTIKLKYSENGSFGINDEEVAISFVNFSHATNELQIFPARALAPGFYRLQLLGNATRGEGNYLADLAGNPLGENLTSPNGKDFNATFQITGVEGRAGATTSDATLATARELGDITNGGMQVVGAIGDDTTDPVPWNSSDVDLYRFRITGPGRYAFAAEAFAGRIGSPLDASLTLYKLVNGKRVLVDANGDSRNDAKTTNGMFSPLYMDPVIYSGLEAGEYCIAVSGVGSVGRYVLNVASVSDNVAPQVLATTPGNASTLANSPTHFTVTFTEAVNLQALAFKAYDATSGQSQAVFVEGADGTRYIPRLIGFDATTNTATFLMLDGLSNGVYELHLSGEEGLADFAGHRVVGNDPSGDYVATFTVDGPVRGIGGDPQVWANQEPNDTLEQCQELGVLFPHELQVGVTITRNQNPNVNDVADYFLIEVVQFQTYLFNLTGANLPEGTGIALFDAEGNFLGAATSDTQFAMHRALQPGTYRIGVGIWSAADAPTVSYQLHVSLLSMFEWPPSLTSGPAPAIRIRLATELPGSGLPSAPPVGSPPSPTTPPQVVLPAIDIPVVSRPSTRGTGFPSVYIPPSLLLGLGTGPVGGVFGENNASMTASLLSAPPDQVVIRSSNPTYLDGLVRMTVLTPPGPYDGNTGTDHGVNAEEVTEQEPASPDMSLIETLLQSWQRTLDATFGMSGWMRLLPILGVMPTGQQSDVRESPEKISLRKMAEVDAAFSSDATTPDSAESMLGALAAVGMAVGLRQPKTRRRRRRSVRLRAPANSNLG